MKVTVGSRRRKLAALKFARLRRGDTESTERRKELLGVLTVFLVFALIFTLYVATLARSIVLGDPTEYTFIAYILGIAHPPGYAFMTLAGKLFQMLVPAGTIAWRMHLLSAVAATLAAMFVYGTVRVIVAGEQGSRGAGAMVGFGRVAAVFAALTVAAAANFWQHAIHANPHIMTAAFLAANLFLLTKWWGSELGSAGWHGREPGHSMQGSGGAGERGSSGWHGREPGHSMQGSGGAGERGSSGWHGRETGHSMRHGRETGHSKPGRWLYVFCFVAGLGVTHHPLTVFAFPAYALFMGLVRPSLLREGRRLLKMAGFGLLGLAPWLYFPLRSPAAPFGPTTMNTLSGFLDHVLARGLSDSLPYYSLADQPDRALVFWTLLRLQYALPIIFLAIIGLAWLWLNPATHSQTRELAILYGLAFLATYAFVISLRVQDIMAYLLGPFLVVGLLAGIGLYGLLAMLRRGLKLPARVLLLLVLPLFLLGPGLEILRNAPTISLRHYNEGRAYVEAVFDRFDGRGEGAVLLNDWEHMTPLWYAGTVEGRWPAEGDVRPRWVAAGTDKPWLASVIEFLPGGPVYLSNYRREVVDYGFRLRPAGPFYQVVEPGETSRPAGLSPAQAVGGDVEVVGYQMPRTAVTAGDYVPLTLAMRAPQGTTDFYVPVLRAGHLTFEFTTDSHLPTPQWQPGEVIVERFDFALPHDLGGGVYPLTLDLKNLSTDEVVDLGLLLGQLEVTGRPFPVYTGHLLANFRQRVGLVSASASHEGRRVAAPWPGSGEDGLTAEPGDAIHLTLTWECLAPAEESYTVFVHLIDGANAPQVALDYTPLGGATPTHLWIPKWLPGQQMMDPYRLQIPANLPPGTYYIEVGLYEMVSGRRLHISDREGNLKGDRFILGAVVVESKQ